MRTKETEWTIAFHFPMEVVYPSIRSGYQSVIDENVRTWSNKDEAKTFANRVCGKYDWSLIPTSIENVIE